MKTLPQLAKEAIEVQDACNLSGVVKGFDRALTDLRANMPTAGTDAINRHPISKLWADKIAHLTNTQDNMGAVTEAYSWCHDQSNKLSVEKAETD